MTKYKNKQFRNITRRKGKESAIMDKGLNPTRTDEMWAWRSGANERVVVLSALPGDKTAAAARELAAELAGPDDVVLVTRAGSAEPLFCYVPPDYDDDGGGPDVVLLLVDVDRGPSARLLLATAPRLVILADNEQPDAARPLLERAAESPSSTPVELVVVAGDDSAADATGARLVERSGACIAGRASWRHIPTERVLQIMSEEEMPAMRTRPAPRSDTRLRANDWEESFRRAEKLLNEAQDDLKRRLARTGPQG